MDCKEVKQLLAAYLDNEVTAEERRFIEAHLAVCPECKKELDELAAAQKSLRQAFQAAASRAEYHRDTWREMQPELQAYRPSFLSLLRTRRRRLVVTIIVAAIIIILVVLWVTGILPGFRG
jgi:anti-sigma factor RsiW